MLAILLIGFLGGLVTGISPCILPVLPVVFLSGGMQSGRVEGASPSRWRPFLVIAGLVTSFSVVTLVGSLVLSLLGLPQDVLRWAGIVVLVLIGVGLIVPGFQHLLEKPFSRIPQKAVGTNRNGFGLGLALGAVYVPCAGPVLAAITVAGATGRVGADTIALTLSFAIGAAIPLLVFALAGRGVAERIRAFRSRQRGIRLTGGILMIALAAGLVFDVPAQLQRLIPDYTAQIQERIAGSDEVSKALNLGGIVTEQNKHLDECSNGATELESCGTAPDLTGITAWFNTPGDAPLSLDELRGKVVLIDFWAYSCINCQRSIPHVTAWYDAYEDAGLEVIGVHSPEYAFEKKEANVKAGAAALGIRYPVAIDNSLSTWTTYRNRYWPAHYLIDAKGVVRHITFGEGGYDTTEKLIRQLLTAANPDVQLPPPTDVADTTPDAAQTPETYLGTTKEVNFSGNEAYSATTTHFRLPRELPRDSFALDGDWELGTQSITPAADAARIRLAFTAGHVEMVLSGEGTVTITRGDGSTDTIEVSGVPRSYVVVTDAASGTGTLDAELSRGVTAYSFTFGG
ncbi:Cytochrome c biogenesis protein CcdA [Paramicrobacterium humi]|uniref:Cytochrome c biogenesis protein CcdA n=1 Tax=Paramicrobacterium humi TaxID=640635 RepID=A0A1H4N930_9MICO|nr:cytochrome c biogenesis protein DipZ [Microbacterium humi]SEB91753.1 Cytochrome c biogenesis protein CcdA [Microbacterium humi]